MQEPVQSFSERLPWKMPHPLLANIPDIVSLQSRDEYGRREFGLLGRAEYQAVYNDANIYCWQGGGREMCREELKWNEPEHAETRALTLAQPF